LLEEDVLVANSGAGVFALWVVLEFVRRVVCDWWVGAEVERATSASYPLSAALIAQGLMH